VFSGGAIGALGDSSELPIETPDDSLTAEVAESLDAFAADGDGLVDVVGPTLLLPDTGVQQIIVDVTNVSDVDAVYTVDAVAPSLSLAGVSANISLAAGETGQVQFDVDTMGLTPGSYQFNVSISSDLAGDELSVDELTIVVPDLTDPAQLEQAKQALHQLRSLPSDSGLDPAVRDSLISALSEALPWQAAVTITGNPADKMVTEYEVKSPIFEQNATGEQTAEILSWTDGADLSLALVGTQPESVNYKGELSLLRSDGTRIEAIVSLVWRPESQTFQGSWGSKSAGGTLKIVLTRP
jgi:hypothetical protein